MKTISRLIGLALITVIVVLAGCPQPTESTENIYSIMIKQNGTVLESYTFTSRTPLDVTIENTGNSATGALSIAKSGANAESFELSGTEIGNIAKGGSAVFTVTPESGLAPGSAHNTAITVSGGNGISAVFTVSYTEPGGSDDVTITAVSFNELAAPVTGEEPLAAITGTDEYTAVLSWQLKNAQEDFDDVTSFPENKFAAETVYRAVIDLTAKSGFKFDEADIENIVDYENGTVAAAFNDASSITVTITFFKTAALDVDTWSISLIYNSAEIENITFDRTLTPAFNTAAVTVENTGNRETGALTIKLTGDQAANFTLNTNNATATTSLNMGSLDPQASDTFPVTLGAGRLTEGFLSSTITVSNGSNITKSFTVSFDSRYSISLTTPGFTEGDLSGKNYDFADDTTPITVTVTNTGTNQTNSWGVFKEGYDSAVFKVTQASTANITTGNSSTFTLEPLTTEMSETKTYTATIMVKSTGPNEPIGYPQASFTVSYDYTAPAYSIALQDTDGKAIPAAYYLLNDGEDGKLTVKVLNTGGGATGDLSVALSKYEGSYNYTPVWSRNDSSSFTLGDLSGGKLDSIDIGAEGNFTISANTGLDNGIYIATVTISNSEHSISNTFNIIHWSFSKDDFYGTFTNANNVRRLVLDENSFSYQVCANGNNFVNLTTDIASSITSWKKVTWTAEGNNIANESDRAVENNDTVTAWEIECTITAVNAYAQANPMDLLYSSPPLVVAAPAVGRTFTTWLLCRNPATISGAETNTGINIGYYNGSDPRVRTTQWPNFITRTIIEEPSNFGIALQDIDGKAMPAAYYLLDNGDEGRQFTVKVINTGDAATGDLSVALSGPDAELFTPGGLTSGLVPGIAVDADGSFTITADEDLPNKIYNATVTVSNSGNGLEKSFDIIYWAFKQEDFYGTFTNQGNRRLVVSENSLTYLVGAAGADFSNPTVDIVSGIIDWKKVTWVTTNSSTNIAPANTTLTAWEIKCEVTAVNKWTSAAPMNLIYGLDSTATTPPPEGQTFTTWLLCNNPQKISGTAAASPDYEGINIGYKNASNANTTQWANFIK